MHLKRSWKGKLLVSSCTLTSATLLLGAAAPALAQTQGSCTATQNSTCWLSTTGQPGTQPTTDGQSGGAGGGAGDWSIDTSGTGTLHFQDNGNPSNPISPINLSSVGGAGAGGKDGGIDPGHYDAGNGGLGGNSGDITLATISTTSGSTSTVASGITLNSTGGNGGGGAFGYLNHSASTSGAGGDAGHITANLSGTFPTNVNNTSRGADIWSIGGTGGTRTSPWTADHEVNAPDGGTGGNGGQIDLTLNGTFIGNSGGVRAQSIGGNGGAGGNAPGLDGAEGGDGGAAGNAANVNVTVNSGANLQTYANQDAGLVARSQGGTGGVGGGGGSGGMAGAGGNAGNVNVTVNGGSMTNQAGTSSAGLLAQSLGGNGGDGGSPSQFVIGPQGGSGSNGGTAGTVSVATGSGGGVVTIVSGRKAPYADDDNLSPGVLAQSVGGGGGSGGNATGWFAVGGNGGTAVNGNNASVDLLSNITTYGINSDGIAVQSIGGGGGKGGNAIGTGVGVNMVIGGTGGPGGDGAMATVSSRAGSVIDTTGAHSSGILVQSVGGGGGMGGAAYSKTVSAGFGSSMSLGGNGGVAGDAGDVLLLNGEATNSGRVTTSGSDSYGILAQSIGGGGGVGGASTAMAKVYGGDDVPSIGLVMAMGGVGGGAGTGHTVQAENAGFISTTGAGSVGMLGQSVGGGGGAGGDASSTATSTGGDYGFDAKFTFGGGAGSGGSGGNTTLTNPGLIITTGESADGILAQSIGGGGGNGGAGDSKGSSSAGTTITLNLTMGGNAGNGGDGYLASVTNSGSIITLGDGAFGAAAQSIGGGGGRGGGGAGSTAGDYTANLTIGGTGGGGGNTYHTDSNGNELVSASVTNAGTIVTFGGDANGIIAQSIAGGGGAGGKAATSLGSGKSTGDGGNGSSTTSSTLSSLSSSFDSQGLNGLSQYAGLNGAINATNSLLNQKSSSVSAVADEDPDGALNDLSESKGDTDDDNDSGSIHLAVAVGGNGGNGGAAGLVTVDNLGEIATLGHASDGILAQAIGGGGGKGGASSTASSDTNSGDIAVGGTGGDGGYGGKVTVNNVGTIYTKGALAAGIVAQSISGGGGIGGASASSISSSSKNSGNDDADDGAFKSVTVSVGGNGGGGFDAGQAIVTSTGAISTAAHDSIGVVAQSIAAGGGIVKTIATDQEGAGGAASAKGTNYDIQFKFGGSNASSVGAGYGSGLVSVTTAVSGAITTAGDDSYGILAQSIAGGGGVALGGTPTGSTVDDFFGTGKKTGSVRPYNAASPDNNSGVFVNAGSNITTKGDGSIGILAQSIGGGGGLAGDTGYYTSTTSGSTTTIAPAQYTAFSGGSGQFSGNGGYVQVNIGQGATVSTSGVDAPALFLQSIGGGGGRVTNSNGAFIGTAGGSGQGGNIDVTVNGTLQTTGFGSGGIFAQSEGDSTSQAPINITVGSLGKIIVGQNSVDTAPNGQSAGIYIDHGGTTATVGGKTVTTNNTVTNNGVIQTYGAVANSIAVYSTGGNTQVFNNGLMWGDVLLTNGGGTGCFTNAGSFVSGNAVTVGNCAVTNSGTFDVGASNSVARTTISGDYVQLAGGKLNIDADLQNGNADALTINGKATIAGSVNVNVVSVSNKTATVLTASGGVALDPQLRQTDNSALFDFPLTASGNQLTIRPVAHLSEAAANLGTSQKAMAGYLQQLFDSGASMDDGFTQLAHLSGGRDYAQSLQSMTGSGLGSFGAFRVNSSRSFANNLYQGCRDSTFDRNTSDSCSWARFSGASGDQDARGDTEGYHADSYMLEVGGQAGLSDHLALVGSVGSEKTQFHGADSFASRINGDSAVGGVGVNFADGPLELSGAIDGAYGWYRSYRTITVGGESETESAKPRQWQIGAHLRAAYAVTFAGQTYVKPFVDGHAIRVSNDAFTEEGTSPFRLNVDSSADTAVLGGPGVEFGTYIPMHSGAEFHPFISAAAEFGSDVQWTTTARFANQAGGSGFDVKTAGPGTVGRFAIGADLMNVKNLSFSLLYSPEVGSGYSSQGGTARISYTF